MRPAFLRPCIYMAMYTPVHFYSRGNVCIESPHPYQFIIKCVYYAAVGRDPPLPTSEGARLCSGRWCESRSIFPLLWPRSPRRSVALQRGALVGTPSGPAFPAADGRLGGGGGIRDGSGQTPRGALPCPPRTRGPACEGPWDCGGWLGLPGTHPVN